MTVVTTVVRREKVWCPDVTFFSLSVLSKMEISKNIVPKNKAHLLQQSIFVWTKHKAEPNISFVRNIIWHLWCSNNLIHLHRHPHSNLVLILANKISLNVSKTELILFKPRIKKHRFWSQIKTKWQKTLSNYKILKNILVLKLMRVSPGISILMILSLN